MSDNVNKNTFFEKLKKAFNKRNFSSFKLIIQILLFVYTISMVFLLVWAFFTSLKTRSEFYIDSIGLPDGPIWTWQWGNYVTAFQNFEAKVTFWKGAYMGQTLPIKMTGLIVYSLQYAVGCAFVGTFFKCVTAYVVSKFDLKINKIIYGTVIVTMMIPIVGSAASELTLMQRLGLYDTMLGAWLQKSTFLGLYFLVFYDSFRSLPKDYTEAATLDGAGEFTIFFKIMFPLVRTTFIMVLLLLFIEYWNDYQTPLLFMPTHPTLMFAIQQLSGSGKDVLSQTPMKMACCVIVVIPLTIIFVACSDKIMGNLTVGGVKG